MKNKKSILEILLIILFIIVIVSVFLAINCVICKYSIEVNKLKISIENNSLIEQLKINIQSFKSQIDRFVSLLLAIIPTAITIWAFVVSVRDIVLVNYNKELGLFKEALDFDKDESFEKLKKYFSQKEESEKRDCEFNEICIITVLSVIFMIIIGIINIYFQCKLDNLLYQLLIQ